MTKVILSLVVVSIMAICVANGAHHGGHGKEEKVSLKWERQFGFDNVDGATVDVYAMTYWPGKKFPDYNIIDIRTKYTSETVHWRDGLNRYYSRYVFGPNGGKEIIMFGNVLMPYCIVMDLTETYLEFRTLLYDRHDTVVRADNPEGTVRLTTKYDGNFFDAVPALDICRGQLYNTEKYGSALVGEGEEVTKEAGLKGVYRVISKTLLKWERTFIVDDITGETADERSRPYYPQKIDTPGDIFIDIQTGFAADKGTKRQKESGRIVRHRENVVDSQSRYVFGQDGSAKKQALMSIYGCIIIDFSETYDEVVNTLSTRDAADTPVKANVPLGTLKITTPMSSSDMKALPESIYGRNRTLLNAGFCSGFNIYNTETVIAKKDQEVFKLASLRGVYTVIKSNKRGLIVGKKGKTKSRRPKGKGFKNKSG